VLDGIPVDVINTSLQLVLITASVLPKSALPNRPLPVTYSRSGLHAFRSSPVQKRTGELLLDPAPTQGILRVSFRECPNGVEVVGQEYNGKDFKRTFILLLG
jgi:hypothetical protein